MRYLHYSPSPSPCWGIAQSRSWRGCLGVVGVYVVGCDPFTISGVSHSVSPRGIPRRISGIRCCTPRSPKSFKIKNLALRYWFVRYTRIAVAVGHTTMAQGTGRHSGHPGRAQQAPRVHLRSESHESFTHSTVSFPEWGGPFLYDRGRRGPP